MTIQHKTLSSGRWEGFSLVEQLANVGSEVERAINWKNKGRADYCANAFGRALELIDLTIQDRKNKTRLREIMRVRELLADYFSGPNTFSSSDHSWSKYFLAFALAAKNLPQRHNKA
jgi:hypothetical protein